MGMLGAWLAFTWRVLQGAGQVGGMDLSHKHQHRDDEDVYRLGVLLNAQGA